MAKTPRTWSGARTPSGLKRVRQAARRHEILGPRRTAAKTYVAKALTVAANPRSRPDGPRSPMRFRRSTARPRPAHPPERRRAPQVAPDPQGQRRPWRDHVPTAGRVTKVTGKAAAAKAAKARIAAGKSTKAKGAQTAAGKARAALSKTARAEAAAAKAAAAAATTEPAGIEATAAKATATKSTATKTRHEVDGKGRDEAHRQGRTKEEGLDQELVTAREATPIERPGSARGVVMSGTASRQEAWSPPLRALRLGAEDAVQQRPAQATGRGDHHDQARDGELLRPIEAVNDAASVTPAASSAGARAPSSTRDIAGTRTRDRRRRRSVRRRSRRGSRCRRRRRAP